MKTTILCAACGTPRTDRVSRFGRLPFCSLKCKLSRAGEIARFLSFVTKTETCWIWNGTKKRNSEYGKFKFDGKHSSSHRFAYIRFVGPIPAGLQIDHLCRNPACCNPAHLEAVTGRINLLRGNTFQARNAAKTECLRGHTLDEQNTGRKSNGQRFCKVCRRAASSRQAQRRKAARQSKKFREAFGSDQELLALTDEMLTRAA